MGESSGLEAWWQETGAAELRLILWAAWDPIGHVPRDEYDWYVPRLWPLLEEHATVPREGARLDEMGAADAQIDEWAARAQKSERRLATQLSEWRTERIGLRADPDADQTVAAKLTDWLSPPGIDDFGPIDLLR